MNTLSLPQLKQVQFPHCSHYLLFIRALLAYSMAYMKSTFLLLKTGNMSSCIHLLSQSIILLVIYRFEKHLLQILNMAATVLGLKEK